MNISESSVRKIIREMLLEAEGLSRSAPETVSVSRSTYEPVYDVHQGAKSVSAERRKQPNVAAAYSRMKAAVPKMKLMLIPIMQEKRLVTERNATAEESILMGMYLQWYANARGVQDKLPWSEDLFGTAWPKAALTQFQIDQGLLADGKLGKQTATFIFSAGGRRVAVSGMTLAQSDVMANLDDQILQLDPTQNAASRSATIKRVAGTPAYTSPAARAQLYTKEQQKMLGRPAATKKPAGAYDLGELPVNKSLTIDEIKEAIMDSYDDRTDPMTNDDMLEFSASEIARYRRGLETLIDVDLERLASDTSGRSARNLISIAVAKKNIPIVGFLNNVPKIFDRLERILVIMNPALGFTPLA